MLYRIFTEDKNQDQIEKLAAKHFTGFTLVKGQGFWRLQKENTLIIEIVTDDVDAKINSLAREIKSVNAQEAVLIQKIENNQWLI
ncbi:hypothetical protein ES707_01408 [subsurface metagenome]